MNGDYDNVCLLIEHNADYLKKNSLGYNAWECAEQYYHDDVKKELGKLMLKDLLWQRRSPLLKAHISKESSLLKKISTNVLREILKYA